MAEDPELSLLTRILRTRLAEKCIFDYQILEKAAFLAVKDVNQHIGSFVGFFTRRPKGNICFFVFVRSDPSKYFDHIFGYYVNVKFYKIPKSELDQFRGKATPGSILSVQMVQTDAHQVFYPSVLIQMIVFTLGSNLIDDFKKYRLLPAGGSDLFLCFNPSIGYPRCGGPEADAKRIIENHEAQGFVIRTFDCTKPSDILPDVDLLIIFYKSHLIYGVHYKNFKLLNIILPHVVQFAHSIDVSCLKITLNRAFGSYKLNGIVASRIYSIANEPCNGVLALKACALALRHPFVSIRDSELRAVVSDLRLDRPFPQPSLQVKDLTPVSSQPKIAKDADSSQPKDVPAMEKTVRNNDDYDMVSYNCADYEPPVPSLDPHVGSQAHSQATTSSQATVIMSAEELRLHLFIAKKRRWAKDLLVYPFFKDHFIDPLDDPHGTFLNDSQLYCKQLLGIIDTLTGYTTAEVIIPGSMDNFDEELTEAVEVNKIRFLVLPMILNDSSDALLVVDNQNEEWGFMCPDNKAWRDEEMFKKVKEIFSGTLLSKYEGLAINMTSYYHTAYPKIHLLMGLYHISKAFRYASILPKKVVYKERDFRLYCHHLCQEVAIANTKYNLEKQLIKPNGFLAKGAYISASCPVTFERAVVNEDQCVFCLSRSFKNIGSHMSMKHGGYGLKNRSIRRWRDALKE